jgi:hypothetical protein
MVAQNIQMDVLSSILAIHRPRDVASDTLIAMRFNILNQLYLVVPFVYI